MDIDMVEDRNADHTDLDALMAVLSKDAQKEIVKANSEIMCVIRALGGSRRRCMRERIKGIKAVVSEIYSPPRVTAATKLLPELRIIPGFALDLTTSDTDGVLWDFDSKVM